MPSKSIETTIAKPVSEVYRFLTDDGDARQWNPSLEGIEGDSGPLKPGARWVELEKSWGRVSRTHHEVVELVPDQRLVVGVANGGFRGIHTISLDGIGDSTQVVSKLDYQFSGSIRLLSPIISLFMKRYMTKYLTWFKDACEHKAGSAEAKN